MSEHTALDAVLDNIQVPHQPLVIIADSAVFSGLPVFKEALRRALSRPGPVLLVTALHDPEDLGASGARCVNLTETLNLGQKSEDIEQQIISSYQEGAEVFIDAIDILAEDYTPTLVLCIVRKLLSKIKASKPPSRLTLLLPHTSPFLDSLLPPTLSPALTLVHTYHPLVLSHLSRSYLLPIDSSPNFTTTLDRARDRQLPEKLAYGGLDGVEVVGDWSAKGAIVSVLVRKATGGIKGISRSLVSLKLADHGVGLRVGPLSDLVSLSPVHAPGAASVDRPAATHVDLDLPFNLSLTDEQKRRRGEVPLPYAHEGEGVGIEFGEDDDDEDED